MVLVMARQEAYQLYLEASQGLYSQAKAKGDYLAQIHSDQMVLVIARREAGPVAWWPKTLK